MRIWLGENPILKVSLYPAPSLAVVTPDPGGSPRSHPGTYPQKGAGVSPISWVKRDAWQIFCPLIKGCFPVSVRHTFFLISASDYTLCPAVQWVHSAGLLCVLSPISNESRLCSLEAANRAPWAVIREKVFNTGQAATGGLR